MTILLIGAIVCGLINFEPVAGLGIMSIATVPIIGFLKTSLEYREEKGGILDKAQLIISTAKEEKRTLTEEENTKYDGYLAKMKELDADIKRAEETERRAAEMAGNVVNKANKEKEKKELKRFSFTRFLSGVANNKMDGFEMEMHQEGQKEAQRDAVQLSGRGFVVPQMITNPYPERRFEKRDMTAGADSAGGYAVPTILDDFIGYLYDRMVLTSLGADFMTGLTGNLSFPTELTVAAATWEGETDANAESSPTLGTVAMTPKRLGTFTDISTQLLLQTSPSIEARIRRQLVTAIQLGIETAAINGSGTGGQPTGILNTSDIGSVVGGTIGLAPAWSHIVGLETAVNTANADISKLNYLVNSVVKGALKQTAVGTDMHMIWPVNGKEINGYNVGVSDLVPSNLDKGTSTGVCSAIIFGNFEELMIGMWGGIEVLPDPYTQAANGMLRLVINSFADIAVAHAASFAAMKDALTA